MPSTIPTTSIPLQTFGSSAAGTQHTTQEPVEAQPSRTSDESPGRQKFEGLARRSSSPAPSAKGTIRRGAALPVGTSRVASNSADAVDGNNAIAADESTGVSTSAAVNAASGTTGAPPIGTTTAQTEPTHGGVPATMAKLQTTLGEWKTEDVDLDRLARVLQDVRYFPLHEGQGGTVPSIRELVARIAPEQREEFYRAFPVLKDGVKGREAAAEWKGRRVPTSATVFNMFNYLGIPAMTEHIENPWHTAFIGLGVASAQPVVVASIQPLVIGSLDYLVRLEQPEVKLDKSTINFNATQGEIKAQILTSAKDALESEQGVATLFKRYGFVDGNDQIDSSKVSMDRLTPEVRNQLIEACQTHMKNTMTLCMSVSRMHTLDGAHHSDLVSTFRQIAPRGARNLGSALAAFLREPGPDTPYSKVGALVPHKLSPWAITGLSMGIASGALVWQHVEAGKDEINRLIYDDKMDMLHADLFTEGRKEAVARTGTITASDLSMKKCKEQVIPAAVTIVQRTGDRMEADLKELRSQLDAQQSTPAPLPAQEEGRANGDPDLQQKIAVYERDLAKLRDLTDPMIDHDPAVLEGLHEDTKALLHAAATGEFAMAQGVAKLTKPLELTSQISLRLAQALMMFGLLGGIDAVAGGRVATAALGGNQKISADVQLGLSILTMFIGVFAAATQGMANIQKNRRRDTEPADEAMGFWTQAFKGSVAPVIYGWNRWESHSGRKEAGDTLYKLQGQVKEIDTSLEKLLQFRIDEHFEPTDPVLKRRQSI